jgi:hypothetical protein
MRGRKLRWLLALAGLAVPLAGAWLLWPSPPSRFTLANYARIRAGMAKADVYAVLGPPGDFWTAADAYAWDSHRSQELVAGASINKSVLDAGKEEWYGEEGYIAVCFDAGGRAAYKAHMAGRGSFESLASRVKRQWHRWFP